MSEVKITHPGAENMPRWFHSISADTLREVLIALDVRVEFGPRGGATIWWDDGGPGAHTYWTKEFPDKLRRDVEAVLCHSHGRRLWLDPHPAGHELSIIIESLPRTRVQVGEVLDE